MNSSQVDVAILGAGPAGIAAAIVLEKDRGQTLRHHQNKYLNNIVLEDIFEKNLY